MYRDEPEMQEAIRSLLAEGEPIRDLYRDIIHGEAQAPKGAERERILAWERKARGTAATDQLEAQRFAEFEASLEPDPAMRAFMDRSASELLGREITLGDKIANMKKMQRDAGTRS